MRDDSLSHEAERVAADAIGDVIEHWGFRKALGRVWTVLYLSGAALAAGDLGDRLAMSSGGVSMALTELQRWGVVRRVWRPGERREFFEAETDFWKMISKVVRERERSLAVSVRERLEYASSLLREEPRSVDARARLERLRRLQTFSTMAETVIESFLASQRADFSELSHLLQLVRPAARGRKA